MNSHPDEHVVATVAHELQAPLAAVKAAAQTLAGGAADDPAVRDRLLQVVLDGVEELGRLVDDLLTAARLDAGTLRPVPEPCDAVAVVKEGMALATAATGGTGLPRLDAPGAVPVLADPRRLRQVTTNLVANALVHGGGEVALSVEPVGDRVRISVSDDGPGITDDDAERIFDRYARLPGGSVRGTGLGLAIARELTLAMGGTIVLERGRERGARFVVDLPAAPGRV